MKQSYKFLLFFLIFLFPSNIFSQNFPKTEIDLDLFIQELFAVQDQDLNYEEVYENLLQRYRNPLDLNRATKDDLANLYILSQLQINELLKHRTTFGDFLSVYELQSVPNFDLDIIYKLMPFVEIDNSNWKNISQNLLQRIQNADTRYLLVRTDRTLETRLGYTPEATTSQRYTGSPERTYMRFRISQSQDFSMGFTLEKDAGEQYIWDKNTNRYGMDYISFHFFVQPQKSKFKSIALGDYQLQIGQGLLLSAGFAIGKGAETVQTTRRSQLGLRPYNATLESGYLRGGAFTYNPIKNLDVTLFYSNTARNGLVSTDTTDNEIESVLESIRQTGLHRTQNEINGKGKFREQTMGGDITWNFPKKNLQIGVTYLHTLYNVNFQRNYRNAKDSILYQFEFSGKENYNIGTHFSYIWQNISFFGEGAISKSGGKGGIVGMVASLSPKVEFALNLRHYDRNFHTFWGNALSEGTRNINEQGIYWGIKYTHNRKWKFAGYYDYFKFGWLRYRVDAPSEGYEYLLRLTHNFSKKITIYGQMREENKARNLSSDISTTNYRNVQQAQKRNFILDLDFQTEKIFSFNTRVQFSTFDFAGNQTSGFAVVQDLGIKLKKLRLNGRYALFGTDDYDNRQYVFEKDVLWFFSIPAYYGEGVRFYLLAQYNVNKKIDFWIKYSQFQFQKQDQISSAGETINGNTRTDIRLQMRYKF